MVKDMCHDFIWRVKTLYANFGFCNISTKRQLFMSYYTSFYVCGTHKTNVLRSFILSGAKVSVNCSIYHCNMVPLLADCLPIQIQIMIRIYSPLK